MEEIQVIFLWVEPAALVRQEPEISAQQELVTRERLTVSRIPAQVTDRQYQLAEL
jgi:hypothetical protein